MLTNQQKRNARNRKRYALNRQQQIERSNISREKCKHAEGNAIAFYREYMNLWAYAYHAAG